MSFWNWRGSACRTTRDPTSAGFWIAQTQQDDEVGSAHRRARQPRKRAILRYTDVPSRHPACLAANSQSGKTIYRLRLASIDPDYFPALEAAYVCHFKMGRRFLEFGLLALLFIHLIVLLPFRLIGSYFANKKMDAYFVEHGLGYGRIMPGQDVSGFVFTELDEGTKRVNVRLLSLAGSKSFAFSLPIPGLHVDHHSKEIDDSEKSTDVTHCDEAELHRRLVAEPQSTTNSGGTRHGDPLNLVAIGDFDTILTGFGARWDETETISLKSCWRIFKAFSLGSSYRYSPVSSLYVEGRSQDFALQKARQTINERACTCGYG